MNSFPAAPQTQSRIDWPHRRRGEHEIRFYRDRHLTIRSSFSRAALMARARLHSFLLNWLSQRDFVELHAPIITKLPLYEPQTAVSLTLHEQDVFLTQCVGFYLEAAAVGLERVFNIGPSFRAEESKSPRHLVEYWHVKIEAMWLTRGQTMNLCEELLRDAVDFVRDNCQDLTQALGGRVPAALPGGAFPSITYRNAVEMLQERGHPAVFGDHLGPREEEALADVLLAPTWVCNNPRSMEPFVYRVSPEDPECTVTADLVLPNGYGELLGIAEKISDPRELEIRMLEKTMDGQGVYSWVTELRQTGLPTHSGMGMGFERLLRWLFQTQDVRDYVAFPRTVGRPFWP